MRWTPGGISSDVEDRRSEGGGGGFRLGGLGGGGMGLGGIVLVLIVSAIFGINPLTLLSGGSGGGTVRPVAEPERTGGARMPGRNS